MNAEFFEAIADIEKEKGIPRQYMYDKINQAMLTAFRRDNPECGDNVEVLLDEEKKQIDMGCYVQDGKIQRGCQVRVLRDNIVVHEGDLASLRRFKDDVKEAAEGYECGMQIEKFNEVKVGDIIECFVMQEIKK